MKPIKDLQTLGFWWISCVEIPGKRPLEKQVLILECALFCIFRCMVKLPPTPEKQGQNIRMVAILFSYAIKHQLDLSQHIIYS